MEHASKNRGVRVRFAPSPTGPLHLGGVRTALYNYLFARQQGGTFILRIEDTDQTRFVSGAESYIMESLRWCGIEWDEGQGVGGPDAPYRQSERKPMYREYAMRLIESGNAYYAFDTAEELETVRERMKQAGNPSWQYNHITRVNMKNSLTLPSDEVERRLSSGEPYVIRMKMPRNEEIRVHDKIRGIVVVNSDNLDDKVLFKSDGMPTYHLANVVDDYLMGITHVIRGEEWLPSAPLHVMLYKGLGWESAMPEFAHLPLILKPDGNGKLSKRDGDRLGFPVFPLEWIDPVSGEKSSGYRESGWLPEAVINLIALLGWHPSDNREVFDMESLVAAFSLDKVAKAGAKFDVEKARWFNQHYLRDLSAQQILSLIQAQIPDSLLQMGEERILAALELVHERMRYLTDAVPEICAVLERPSAYDSDIVAKRWKADSAEKIEEVKQWFEGQERLDAAVLTESFNAWLQSKGYGMGAVMPLVRLCLTGNLAGPSVFDLMALLGKEEVLTRMNIGSVKMAEMVA
jgi:glutamyl-tRNA synthetase